MNRAEKVQAIADAVVAAGVARELALFDGIINGIGAAPSLRAFMDAAADRVLADELRNVGLDSLDDLKKTNPIFHNGR